MSRRISLNLFFIIFILLISPICKSQDTCKLLEKEIKTEIYNLFPGNDKIYKDSVSAYFIVDLKLDKVKKSTTSVDYFYKSSLTHIISKYKEKLDSLFLKPWKNNCHVDRLLIPIFFLPVFEDAVVEEYPIDLHSGLKKSNGEDYNQFIFEMTVIIINKVVR